MAGAQRHAGAVVSGAPPPPARSPAARLAAEPARFDLDQAAHVAAAGGDPMALAYRNPLRLALPAGDVAAGEGAAGEGAAGGLARRGLTVTGLGLLGPGGVLPRHYTEAAAAALRQMPPAQRVRGAALPAFLEMLARRLIGAWVKAGAKYRPARAPAPAQQALAAAAGLATPGLASQAQVPLAVLLYHAGHLASRSRSAERLCAMLEAECGWPVAILEFTGGWQRLPVAERSRLGCAHGRLGVDLVAGAQVRDPAASFTIRIGPLDAAGFATLAPGGPLHRRLCALARLHVGPETDFVVNPVLAAGAVPALHLSRGVRLGQGSWLGMRRPRRGPAAEARLRPPPDLPRPPSEMMA